MKTIERLCSSELRDDEFADRLESAWRLWLESIGQGLRKPTTKERNSLLQIVESFPETSVREAIRDCAQFYLEYDDRGEPTPESVELAFSSLYEEASDNYEHSQEGEHLQQDADSGEHSPAEESVDDRERYDSAPESTYWLEAARTARAPMERETDPLTRADFEHFEHLVTTVFAEPEYLSPEELRGAVRQNCDVFGKVLRLLRRAFSLRLGCDYLNRYYCRTVISQNGDAIIRALEKSSETSSSGWEISLCAGDLENVFGFLLSALDDIRDCEAVLPEPHGSLTDRGEVTLDFNKPGRPDPAV